MKCNNLSRSVLSFISRSVLGNLLRIGKVCDFS